MAWTLTIWHKPTLEGHFHLIWGMWRSSFFKLLSGQPSNPGGKSLDSIALECNIHDVFTWRWSWYFRPTFAGQSSDEKSFIYLKPWISIARTKYHSAYYKFYITEQDSGFNKNSDKTATIKDSNKTAYRRIRIKNIWFLLQFYWWHDP